MTYDTLYDGTNEKSLKDWGFELASCGLERANSDSDYFEGRIGTAFITDNPVFAFEQQVIIRSGRASTDGSTNSFSGGVVKFTGTALTPDGSSSGSGQGVRYRFDGTSYSLEKTIYQQSWQGVPDNPLPLAEIILFTSTRNSTGILQFISVGDTLQDVLQWVLDSYAALSLPVPFQYIGRTLHSGAIDLSGAFVGPDFVYTYPVAGSPTIDASFFTLFYNTFICRPMTAMQALQKCLEFSPRTNMGVDYSTTPPTVYIRSIDNFPSVSVPLFDGVNHKSNNIQRRDDMRVRSVVIKYRITNTVDGQQVIDYQTDKWGPGGSNAIGDPNAGPRVMVDFLDLQGFSETIVQGHLDCEPLPSGFTPAQLRAWWSEPRGGEITKLLDSRIRFTAAAPAPAYTYASNGLDSTGAAVIAGQTLTGADAALFTNRLVRGTHHAWMKLNPTTPIKSVKVRASGTFTYDEYDVVATGDAINILPVVEATSNAATNGNQTASHALQDHHVNLELTNGTTGVYSTTASLTPGESAVVGAGGLANYLYNALNVYQYEGDYLKIAGVFDNSISILNCLNLTGGRSEWTAMNAQIQSIKEDFGTHETSVKLGLAKHLSTGEFQSLLNMWRNRRPWVNPALRADNTAGGGGGEVDMAQTAGNANTTEGTHNPIQKSYQLYTDKADPTTPLLGMVNCDASMVDDIISATTPTTVSGDPKKVVPTEVKMCASDGTLVYAVIMSSGTYTKS